MVEFAIEFSKLNPKLNVEERNILSVVTTDVLGSMRFERRAINSNEHNRNKK